MGRRAGGQVGRGAQSIVLQLTAAAVSWEEMIDSNVAEAITATIIQTPVTALPTQDTGATSPYPTVVSVATLSHRVSLIVLSSLFPRDSISQMSQPARNIARRTAEMLLMTSLDVRVPRTSAPTVCETERRP